MATPPILDPATLHPDQPVFGKQEILRLNPQRAEFEQLDSILHLDLEGGIAVACKAQRPDEFWVKGHVPGRPLMPGVMMIEMAAQLCSFFYHKKVKDDGERFFGFGGVDKVKFRGTVEPGKTFVMMVKIATMRSRLAAFESQGYVDGKRVFEGIITGVIL